MSDVSDFQNLIDLCQRTHEELHLRAGRAVDLSLVARNWMFGRHIVEFEQNGTNRANYGAKLIPQLSKRLKESLGKGFSVRVLEQCRKFYLSYPEIAQTLSAAFKTKPSTEIWQMLSAKFTLSWSHYVSVLTIDDPGERHFYELEAEQNQWSVRDNQKKRAAEMPAPRSRDFSLCPLPMIQRLKSLLRSSNKGWNEGSILLNAN
jgi:hypothetical protein